MQCSNTEHQLEHQYHHITIIMCITQWLVVLQFILINDNEYLVHRLCVMQTVDVLNHSSQSFQPHRFNVTIQIQRRHALPNFWNFYYLVAVSLPLPIHLQIRAVGGDQYWHITEARVLGLSTDTKIVSIVRMVWPVHQQDRQMDKRTDAIGMVKRTISNRRSSQNYALRQITTLASSSPKLLQVQCKFQQSPQFTQASEISYFNFCSVFCWKYEFRYLVQCVPLRDIVCSNPIWIRWVHNNIWLISCILALNNSICSKNRQLI